MEALVYDFGTWLESIGPWAYVLAPLAMACVAILPIPAEFPAVLNGMMFGPVLGTLFTWGGALAGAQISFELARRIGRPLAERFVPERSLEKADRIVLKADWWGLLLPRFIPLIAFTALNWGAGLTPVPRGRFFWTTAVGIFPGALVFTASGGRPSFPAGALPWCDLGDRRASHRVRRTPPLSEKQTTASHGFGGRLDHRSAGGGGSIARSAEGRPAPRPELRRSGEVPGIILDRGGHTTPLQLHDGYRIRALVENLAVRGDRERGTSDVHVELGSGSVHREQVSIRHHHVGSEHQPPSVIGFAGGGPGYEEHLGPLAAEQLGALRTVDV